jgi:hypothetical protein
MSRRLRRYSISVERPREIFYPEVDSGVGEAH